MNTPIQDLTINTIRMLSAEGVEKAKSGHPGMALGAAPIIYTLFSKFLKFNPNNPKFRDRDRFILSAGHASMLNYSALHLFGYNVSMEDIKNFRQLGSKTPGHPEYGHTDGIETTTGPLGQGIANAVGMAVAESHLSSVFNRPGFNIVDHYTYALCGDGCMQEGIQYEAASFAGTYGLNKLILFYDKNDITIEGGIDITFREDVGARYEAMGWFVQKVVDGNSVEEIESAIKKAKAQKKKPSLIIVKTTIGYGSPLAGSEACHGAPLGQENYNKTRENLGYKEQPFTVSADVKKHIEKLIEKGGQIEKDYKELLGLYSLNYSKEAKEFENWLSGKNIPDLIKINDLWKFDKPDATRNTSYTVLNKLAEIIPNLMGGSADLAHSNKSYMKSRSDYLPENKSGSNMHFGVREHAMAAIANGMYLHGGLNVYCSTFFVFTDYMKNAMRLSALMNIRVIYILTHDSIGVGEDGPTHQPVEQLIGLRSIPGFKVFRPADGKETTAAWISALTGEGPTALVLTRQNLPQYCNSGENALKGGYILEDCENAVPDALLIASGSEVELMVKARAALKAKGINARVISMPCMELYDKQSEEYKESVMPKNVRLRVACEAASPYSFYKYTGIDGAVIGMETFGASAPYDKLLEKFGFTVDNVFNTVVGLQAKIKVK